MPAQAYHVSAGPFTTGELAQRLSLSLQGQDDLALVDVLPLNQANSTQLSFLDNPRYKADLEKTKAGAVILKKEFLDLLPEGIVALVSEEPYADYARALALFYPSQAAQGVHETAVVDHTAEIGKGTSVGPNCYIGPGVKIGENCLVSANVTIQCTQMGNGVIVHPGAAIGQDGFGFAPCKAGIVKVPQVGGVIIEDGVEIGANTTIDRGALTDTIIGAGTKIDNLVQIAHNVKIGRMCMIVAQSGIAGSTTLGDGVVIGGQAGVAGHLKLADRIMVAGRSGVTKSFDEVGLTLGGFPAVALKEWRKLQAMLARMSKAQQKK
jgi:UDP-3-O-[3-hydroxymyristoyl] glucosamine N-acyltransferase